MTETKQLEAVRVPIGSLKPFKGNPRVGNLEILRESLRRYGQFKPLVVRTKTKEILAGNHTWLAAKEEGWEEIWVTFFNCDAQTARRIVAIDNRSSDFSTYNEPELIALLGSLPDLSGTGWTGKEFDRIASQLALNQGGDTEAGEPPDAPRTKIGDLWTLGEHRILCGDSTKAEDLDRLMMGAKATCLWTDPPYGTGGAKLMSNNVPHRLEDFLSSAFGAIDQILEPGSAIYIMWPSGRTGVIFGHCYLNQGWQWRQTLVWLKEAMSVGPHDYQYQHEMLIHGGKSVQDAELIAYGYTKTKESRGRMSKGRPGWEGNDKQSSIIKVIEVDKSRAPIEDHPTPRPASLVEHCLVNSTKKGDLVLDPFDGSGTTLIACENIRRTCRAMEIEPKFVDVAVQRWERHTGMEATVEHAPA